MRKDALANNYVYHVMNKSIAGYTIFNNVYDYLRFVAILKFYLKESPELGYATFLRLPIAEQEMFLQKHYLKNDIVEIIAYCIMPTHFHLILRQLIDDGISKFVSNVCNSYSHYFNLKHNRKGPLWQGRFKNVSVEGDEQLLHLTRYIHLNPVTSNLIEDPEDWEFSSYKEYIQETNDKLCNFDILDIKPGAYRRFANSQKDYQKRLHIIRKEMIE